MCALVLRKLLFLSLFPFLTIPVEAWSQMGAEENRTADANQADKLTLRNAVTEALDRNPMMAAGRAGREIAEAQREEAQAALLPSLQFSETYMNSNNPVFVFGSRLEQSAFREHHFTLDALNRPGSINNFRSAVDLKIPLFNRFQLSSGINQAETREEQADADLLWAEQQLRFQVIQSYYGVVVAEARREVAQQAVETAQEQLSNIKDRFEQGMVVESDLLAMQVQLADFRQQLVEAEGNLETARAALNTVLSRPMDFYQEIAESLEEKSFSVAQQSELIARALKNRPDYLKILMESELREEDVQKAKGQYWPDLNLFANYGMSGVDPVSGSGDFAVGAKLTFNLVDFGRPARVKQALAATRASRAHTEYKRNEIRFEVVQAYQGFRSSQERLNVATASVDQAAEALRIVEDRHGVGLTTITEVLRAQTALLRARMMLLGARYDYYVNFAKTLLMTGELRQVDDFTS